MRRDGEEREKGVEWIWNLANLNERWGGVVGENVMKDGRIK